MGTQVKSHAADRRGLAAIGMTLALAAFFATSMAAFLVAAEVQSPVTLSPAPQQHAALDASRQ